MGEAILARAAGGGGGVKFASGTFVPSANTRDVSIDIGFEPKRWVIFTTETSGRGSFSLVRLTVATNANHNSTGTGGYCYGESGQSSYYDYVSRISTSYNNGVLSINLGSTMGGNTTARFIGGVTYEWYAWA